MGRAVLLAFTWATLGAAAEATAQAEAPRVEALSDDDLDALDAPADGGVASVRARAPDVKTEHDYDLRLLGLPLGVLALLAWNTTWRTTPTGRRP